VKSPPVAQWIMSGGHKACALGAYCPPATAPVFDWVDARVTDIFSSATGNVATVLSAVASYSIAPLDVGGQTNITSPADPQVPIIINPYTQANRVDGDGGSVCGNTRRNNFTNTVLHEARHAYQGAQNGIAGNDMDQDFLVNHIDIAPFTIFLDTVTVRNVCNVRGAPFGLIVQMGYLGDGMADAQPGVNYALEMDAYTFAAN